MSLKSMSTNQRGMLGPETDDNAEARFVIDPSAIKVGKEIGKGAFSVVFSGEYNKRLVAVKCQPKDDNGEIPPYVLKEIAILQKLQHPNVLDFIGAADNQRAKQVWILSEQVHNGDLDALLKSIRKESIPHIGWSRMVQIALDIATGIEFLQSHGIIHRDIKSSNILLGDRFRAKLCDFGFATEISWLLEKDEVTGKTRRKSYCGTDAYMAPEMFLDEDYDESADVFSYGVVLMEMICCRPGNADGFLMRLPQHKFRILNEEFRDALPDSCPPALARLAEECVAFEPSDRPKCSEVVRRLAEILQQKQTSDELVELKPYTPTVIECEPQIEDDNDCECDGDYTDDDDTSSSSAMSEREDEVDALDDLLATEVDSLETAFPQPASSGTEEVEYDEEEEEDTNFAEEDQRSYSFDEETEPVSTCSKGEQQRPEASIHPPYHTGIILKRNRRGNRAWSEKWFILDRGFLHYTDAAGQQNGDLLPTISTLNLRECRLWKTMEMPELCFHVVNSHWKIKRELQALSKEDLDVWTTMLNQGIDYANSLPKSASSHSIISSAPTTTNNDATPPLSFLSAKQIRRMSNASANILSSSKSKSEESSLRQPESTTSSYCEVPSPVDEEDEVRSWLKGIGLERYSSTLKDKGFASLDFIRETGIEKEDLNFLGIKDPAARKALTTAARLLRNE
ncbi:TPA: hypothetical protein N0F65_000440 [Lagenidium giganteum]|uniref:TKL/LISK/LISK-DD1 protein kinase n=1 Tax=Lagenidium giganteum TaxID=4803 RepID=A0AAV2YEI4_9STRA|nr:TPA: hypothetical protein N0F65_000440 [Lagenidium giganteum]